jgi:hypothetical protein
MDVNFFGIARGAEMDSDRLNRWMTLGSNIGVKRHPQDLSGV